jgi:hypothetical protein
MELQEKPCNTGLTSVWTKNKICNLREIKTVKERGDDAERQNILGKFLQKNALTLYREMNFS